MGVVAPRTARIVGFVMVVKVQEVDGTYSLYEVDGEPQTPKHIELNPTHSGGLTDVVDVTVRCEVRREDGRSPYRIRRGLRHPDLLDTNESDEVLVIRDSNTTSKTDQSGRTA